MQFNGCTPLDATRMKLKAGNEFGFRGSEHSPVSLGKPRVFVLVTPTHIGEQEFPCPGESRLQQRLRGHHRRNSCFSQCRESEVVWHP